MTSAIPNSFWQLPPAPLPPNDPTFWLLNGRVGWQAAELDDVAIAGDNLGLLIIPGSARLLTEPSGWHRLRPSRPRLRHGSRERLHPSFPTQRELGRRVRRFRGRALDYDRLPQSDLHAQ